jgi:hypothetical protein
MSGAAVTPSFTSVARGRDRWIPWVLLGGGIGQVLLYRGDLEPRWIVWITAGAFFAVVLSCVQDLRRFLLIGFAASLQLNVQLRLFFRSASSWVGASGPTSIEVSPCLVFGIALLVTETLRGERVEIPRAVRVPALILAVAAALSLVNSPERFVTLCWLFRLATLVCLLSIAASAVRTRDDLLLVANVLVASLVAQCLIYMVEAALGVTFSLEGSTFAGGDGLPRHGGTVGAHANTLASFVVPLTLITMARFVLRPDRRPTRTQFAAVSLGFVTVGLTFTRAAWAGCVLGTLILVLGGAARRRLNAAPIAVLAAVGLAALPLLAPLLLERLAADHTVDYEERAALMKMALQVFRTHPLVGCGAGAYPWVFRHYLTPDLANRWLFVVHNRYVLLAAELGVLGPLGFVLFLWRIIALGARLSRLRDPEVAAYAMGCTAALIALAWNMYWDVFAGLPIDGLMWTLAGTLFAIERYAQRPGWAGGHERFGLAVGRPRT